MRQTALNRYDHVLRHFEKADPLIYEVLQRTNLDEWFDNHQRPTDYFMALCRTVIGQQLSGKAAQSIWTKFCALFPDSLITPSQVRNLQEKKLRTAGLSQAKTRSIQDLAQKISTGSIPIHDFDSMPNNLVAQELLPVKGIGNWSVEMFLMFYLKRENVFSLGDLGLKKGFSKIYSLENPTEAEILDKVTRWTPYETYGAIALWQSLEP